MSSNSPACPNCNDHGFIPIAGTRRFTRCPCFVEKAIAIALPKLYLRARLSDFSRGVTDAITKWLINPGEGLFLTGPTGSGKTYLAAAIIRTVYEIGDKGTFKRATFRRASDLYLQVRNSYGAQDLLSETSIIAGYAGTPLLVLDDLAAGSLSDHERRIAHEVLDRRLNDGRPTIVTSNWTIKQIAEKMDERIASRLSSFFSIALIGKDRRNQK